MMFVTLVTVRQAGRAQINLGGFTQFRLRFALGDNDDAGNDYLLYWSGEAAAGSRPELIVAYRTP